MKPRSETRAAKRAVIAVAAMAMLAQTTSLAMAQSYSNMNCDQLWYARNAIYAQAGYCFQTARARATFGAGCFPPYGQLSGWQQSQVNDIQYWERQRGCR